MLQAVEFDQEAYRTLVRSRGLVSSRLRVRQTDMLVSGVCDLSRAALYSIRRHRARIEDYIRLRPDFLRSLAPLAMDPTAPKIAKAMLEAGSRAGVGPMAAVAGAMADFVGRDLMARSPEVIVENGGDIFLHVSSRREMLILAEHSPLLSVKIAVGPTSAPLGVCTSSGTHGRSLSFGRADAVTVIAESAAYADAAATAVGNRVRSARDVKAGIAAARKLGVSGVLILVEDTVGAWGQVDIIG